ncbi:MAG: isopenicillin N synthase family dioxygenase [Hyphomicrobiaceae bacterium]
MDEQIPVIDFISFRNGGAADRKRIASELGRAAEGLGFAVIGGHGIAPSIGEDLREAALRFFDLPLEDKLLVRRPKNDQNRGYIPFGEETLVRMAGGDSPPDVKEVFAIGPDGVPNTPYFTGPASYPSFAANLWPDAPGDLQPKMLAYWHGMEGVMRMLGEAIAIALGMASDTFADVLDERHTSQLRLLHYPPLSENVEPGQLRAGEHTDVGMMTILRNDPVPGGLQVKGRDGRWIDAPAVADTFILNIGDLLMRWTNDQLVSTLHRVAVPPLSAGARARRLSIGYFVGPRYDAMVECLPACHGPGRPAKYPPVSVHDYRTARCAAGAGDNKPFEAA